MNAWKRSNRRPTRLAQRKNIALSLEPLEDRLLLNAGFGGQAQSNLMGDLTRFRDDVAKSQIALLNDFQSSQTNEQTRGSLASQLNIAMSVLTDDINRMRQDFVQFQFTVLAALGQEMDAREMDAENWLNGLGIYLPGQTTSSAPAASNTSTSSQPAQTSNNASPVPSSKNAASNPPKIQPKDSMLPTVTFFEESNGMVGEGGQAVIAATLSAPQQYTVSVQFNLTNGTAKAGKDFNVTSGTLTFAPGETMASSNVPILDDSAVYEPKETFTATLSNPSGATLGDPSSGVITILEDSDGGTNLPPSMVVGNNNCNCGCPNQSGSTKQNATNTSAPAPNTASERPVRYADGVVTIAETDLHSDGFGFPWGQTRSWTNGPGYATGSDNGNGWVDTYIPHLIQADGSTNNTLIFIANGNTAYYYDLVNGVYQPRIDDGSLLTYNSSNDTYTEIQFYYLMMFGVQLNPQEVKSIMNAMQGAQKK